MWCLWHKEPLDNLNAVEKALAILTHDRALGLSPNHITVSTVGGSAPKLRRLASFQPKLLECARCPGEPTKATCSDHTGLDGEYAMWLEILREKIRLSLLK